MASNFLLNNEITYRAYRYRGLAMAGGFALFALLCSVGAIANVDIASWLFQWQQVWWVAGLAGALVGVVWNYAASTTFVWRTAAAGDAPAPSRDNSDAGIADDSGRAQLLRRHFLAAVSQGDVEVARADRGGARPRRVGSTGSRCPSFSRARPGSLR